MQCYIKRPQNEMFVHLANCKENMFYPPRACSIFAVNGDGSQGGKQLRH